MNEKMRFNVRNSGYCCVYAFLMANASSKEVVAALELGVSPRTIRTWRARLRSGELTCVKACGDAIPLCLMQKIQPVVDTTPAGTSA